MGAKGFQRFQRLLPLKCFDPVGLFQPMSTVYRGDILRSVGAHPARRDLLAEGVVISEMGKASSGRHTVMTFRLPSGARSALEQLASAALDVDFIGLAEAGSQ